MARKRHVRRRSVQSQEDAREARLEQQRLRLRRRERFGQGVSDLLEVPGDLVLNVPRVTIVGNLQMVIENHRGLIEYSPEFIRVGTSTGQMTIAGTDLAVGSVFADDLSVMGRFTRITFEEMPEDEEAP